MVLNIVPYYDESYECLEGVLVTVAKHYKYHYEMMFASSWRFLLLPENQSGQYCSFGSRLNQEKQVDYVKLLDVFHGIKMISTEIKSIADVTTLLEKELQYKRPVVLSVDAYWCPWTYTYKKYFFKHMILLVGVDREKELFYCIDTYYSSKIEQISWNEFDGKIENSLVFQFGKPALEHVPWVELMAKIIASMNYGKEESDFNQIRRFASEIEEKLEMDKEVNGCKILYAVPLFVQLKKIRAYRMTFAQFLEYIAKENNCEGILIYAEKLKEVGNTWSRLSMLFMKLAMASKEQQKILVHRAADLIREIADSEEEIAKSFVQYLLRFEEDENGEG